MTVQPGDVVLVRTASSGLLPDKWAYTLGGAGLTMATALWFREHDVAAVATDSLAFEVYPFDGGMTLPVHLLHLVEMGMTQGQNWVLDDLAADCADDGQYDFPAGGLAVAVRAGGGLTGQPRGRQVRTVGTAVTESVRAGRRPLPTRRLLGSSGPRVPRSPRRLVVRRILLLIATVLVVLAGSSVSVSAGTARAMEITPNPLTAGDDVTITNTTNAASTSRAAPPPRRSRARRSTSSSTRSTATGDLRVRHDR